MTDEIIKELWEIKDNIAKEHEYDLDSLVAYLQTKRRERNLSNERVRLEDIDHPLRGTILKYDDPFEPIAVEDWYALQ